LAKFTKILYCNRNGQVKKSSETVIQQRLDSLRVRGTHFAYLPLYNNKIMGNEINDKGHLPILPDISSFFEIWQTWKTFTFTSNKHRADFLKISQHSSKNMLRKHGKVTRPQGTKLAILVCQIIPSK